MPSVISEYLSQSTIPHTIKINSTYSYNTNTNTVVKIDKYIDRFFKINIITLKLMQ